MIRIVLSLLFVVLCSIAPAHTSQFFRIIFPTTDKDVRVMGFDLAIAAGRVAALGSCPPGWHVQVDNDAAWHATFSAHASVGAAAIDASELQKIVLLAPAPDTVADTTVGKFSVVGTVTVLHDGDLTQIPLRGLRMSVSGSTP